jgi:hypothetical protein
VKRLLLMLAVLAGAAYVGCKQADGDRCQVNADCASGVCNKAKGTCSISGDSTEDIDAPVVIDALPDSPPPPADAAVDAP